MAHSYRVIRRMRYGQILLWTGESHMLRVRNFLSDESGVTAIEYALIASLIAVFIIVAVRLVGTQVSTVFNEIGTTLK